MQTELNKKLKDYFKKTNIENINIEGIRIYFPNIKITNEYGGLVHGAVNEKFDEKKVLKFIKVLFDNGVSANVRGNKTGYNYIQLALYGYTDNEQDYSYSTEFIVKLIELGKKYGLNVQSCDNDKDSIVHTALASEIFTGDTIAILDALGKDFDLECVDNKKRNVYEALIEYRKEADFTKNKKWLNRLNACADELKRRMELKNFNIDEVNREIGRLQNVLEEAKVWDIQIIIKNYKSIIDTKQSLIELLDKKEKFTVVKEDKKFVQDINKSIELKAMAYLKEMSKTPNSKKFVELEGVLVAFDFQETIAFLKELEFMYQNNIEKVKNSFNNAESLEKLQILKKELENFNEEEIVFELTSLFEKKVNEFNDLIIRIQNLLKILMGISENIGEEHNYFKKLESMSILELQNEKENLSNEVNEKKLLLKEIISEKVKFLVKDILIFASSGIFSEDEIFELLITIINDERQDSEERTKKIIKK